MDEDTKKNNKKNKKKHITCFKCKETGHYSNECPNADDNEPTKNKKGTNFLVLNKDHDSSEEETELTISHEFDEEEESSDDDTGDDIAEETQDKESEDYEDYEGFSFVQGDVLCSIQDKLGISSSWILQSTIDVFCNPKLISNIHDAKRTLALYCNARRAIISKKGDLKGYGMV